MGQWYQKTLSLTAAILVSISFVAAASIATDNTLEEYDPDDLYVEVYNTILGADEARQMGKKRAAWELYSQAQNLLQDIQKKYPDWNKKLIDFRLSYVKAKMEQFTEQTASDTENSPQSEIEIEVQRLRQQVEQLEKVKEVLESRLKEATSALPSTSDPKLLAEAEKNISELTEANARLKAQVEKLSQNNSISLELKPSNSENLSAQNLNKEIGKLNITISELKEENKLLQEKLSQTSQTNDSLQNNQKQRDSILTLNNELKQLQETNKIQKQRIETLSKAETKLSSLQPQYETAQNELIQLRTTINQLQNKLSNTEEKAKNLSNKDEVNLLKNEINSLKKELEGITEENKVLRNIGSKKGASKILNDIDKLRAKIAAYELNKEPYTPEELALLKSGERLHIGERLATQTDSNNNSPQSAPLFASPEARTITAEAIQKLQDRNGNFNEAERLLQRALALDENNIYILAHLALTELKLKKISEAESYLKKAYDLAPDNTFVLNLLGELYFHQNKYDNSFEILSQSYKLDPNNPDTLYQLGVVFAEKGLRDDAEKAFRKAIKLAPKYAEPHFNLAVIYATRNPAYPQLANFHYQKAVSLGLPRNMEFEKALQVSMENRTSNEK